MIAIAIVLAGIAVFFLLLLMRKRSIVFSPRVGRIFFICLCLVSLLINAGVLWRHLVTECVIGEGQYEFSPNGLYVARATSYRPLLRSLPAYYILLVESRAGEELRRVRIDMPKNKDPLDFRGLPKMAHWSGDSTEVTFLFPGIQMTIGMKSGIGRESGEGMGGGNRRESEGIGGNRRESEGIGRESGGESGPGGLGRLPARGIGGHESKGAKSKGRSKGAKGSGVFDLDRMA
jgi:hypothetical protein